MIMIFLIVFDIVCLKWGCGVMYEIIEKRRMMNEMYNNLLEKGIEFLSKWWIFIWYEICWYIY